MEVMLCLLRMCEMCGAHLQAFKSQTGAPLDLSISSFQTLCVEHYCLEQVKKQSIDEGVWAVMVAATPSFVSRRNATAMSSQRSEGLLPPRHFRCTLAHPRYICITFAHFLCVLEYPLNIAVIHLHSFTCFLFILFTAHLPL